MSPDLSGRVTVALDEVRALAAADAERYMRELRQSDPEVARMLALVLGSEAPGPDDVPTVPYDERVHGQPAGSPPGGPGDHHQAPHGEPTVSEDAKLTASWLQPTHGFSGGASCGSRPAGPILGRFQLLRMVGRGGFGEVWQAYDPALQKHVAVKAPLSGSPGHPHLRGTFLQEARKAASLRHPAIVQVYDVGESESGWYIVSEFVEGESLRGRMAAGRLPFEQSARIIATVAGALHAAHLAGLVHRDVKPSNILLDRTGNAYLTDFGLAVREDEQLAERSKVSGTLAYMSPEQISGDTHLMDGRADIYSLGAVLYELLTGRALFRAGDIDEYRELILRREPRPPRSIDDTIPEGLERICLKCLAKQVRDRYRTAQDLAADLEAWLAGAKRSDTLALPPPTPVPRWLKLTLAGALLLSVLGGAVGVAVLSGVFDGGRTGSTQPELIRVPGLPIEPARKVPTIKELLWPKERPLCKWEVLPETNQLKVYTDSSALLQLGETNADSWDFTVTLRQLETVGRIGVFLGHHRDPQTTRAAFELVCLVVVGEKAFIQRSVETYPFAAPFAGTDGCVYASVELKGLRPENTIRLVVRGNLLSEVRFNGEPIPELLRGSARPSAAGPFGVYNRNSDGIFSNPRFNDKPIPLLAEASALTPERR